MSKQTMVAVIRLIGSSGFPPPIWCQMTELVYGMVVLLDQRVVYHCSSLLLEQQP